jgi:hypothetical protein
MMYCKATALLQGCVMASLECCIGYEAMAPGVDTMQLPACEHVYNVECITKWFNVKSTCPVCRKNYLEFLPAAYKVLGERMRALHE